MPGRIAQLPYRRLIKAAAAQLGARPRTGARAPSVLWEHRWERKPAHGPRSLQHQHLADGSRRAVRYAFFGALGLCTGRKCPAYFQKQEKKNHRGQRSRTCDAVQRVAHVSDGRLWKQGLASVGLPSSHEDAPCASTDWRPEHVHLRWRQEHTRWRSEVDRRDSHCHRRRLAPRAATWSHQPHRSPRGRRGPPEASTGEESFFYS